MKKLLIVFFAATSILVGQIPTDGLVAYYPFNGNGNDESGNGHNANAVTGSFVADRFGNVVSAGFYSGSSVTRLPSHSDFTLSGNEFALSVWVTYHIIDDNDRNIMVKSEGVTSTDNKWILWYKANDPTGVAFGTGSLSPYITGTYTCVAHKPALDKWYHYVFSKYGNNLNIYLDGVLLVKDAYWPYQLPKVGTELRIGGKEIDGSGNGWIGNIDDIRIYNRQLNQIEVSALYQEGGWLGNIPEPPQNLITIPSNTQVTLNWDKNTEADFLKYFVYMGLDSTTMILKDSTSALVTETTKTITGLTSGTIYYFRVSALTQTRLESEKSFATNTLPIITGFTPTTGPVNTTTVTITGTSFGVTQGTSTVVFGTTVATVVSWSNTSITATVPNLSAGSYTISITTSTGTASSSVQFMAKTPVLTLSSNKIVMRTKMVGLTSDTIITFSNTGDALLEISGMTSNNPAFYSNFQKNATWYVQTGSAITFTISFKPTNSSNVKGQITIISNAPSSPDIIDIEGIVIPATGVDLNSTVSKYSLLQNFPNPFNPETSISYSLPTRSRVHLYVYNILGQIIADLVNAEQPAGIQSIVWNANVSSGLYFYRIEAVSMDNPNKQFVETKKMILLR